MARRKLGTSMIEDFKGKAQKVGMLRKGDNSEERHDVQKVLVESWKVFNVGRWKKSEKKIVLE